MRELTGQDEMAFLDRPPGGVHTRLAGFAAAVEGAAPATLAGLDLAAWEDRLLGLRARLLGRRIEAEAQCPSCGVVGNAAWLKTRRKWRCRPCLDRMTQMVRNGEGRLLSYGFLTARAA